MSNVAVYPWPNDAMRGRVVVEAFAVESIQVPGYPNENFYHWDNNGSDADWSSYFNQMSSAFSFWASEAAARGITLSFLVNVWHWSSPNCQTRYEPTLHVVEEDYLYINDNLRAVFKHVAVRPDEYPRQFPADRHP